MAPMRYRHYYVNPHQNGSVSVVSTGPVVAWWTFLGKVIVLCWPFIFHSIVDGWVGWFLVAIVEVAWIGILLWCRSKRSV